MQEASFSGVLRAIFYFIIFYYILKFVMRLLLPVILRKAVSKAEENLRNHQQGYTREEDPKVHRDPRNIKPDDKKKVGEYVDFEEIE